jgi:hypothetical protein
VGGGGGARGTGMFTGICKPFITCEASPVLSGLKFTFKLSATVGRGVLLWVFPLKSVISLHQNVVFGVIHEVKKIVRRFYWIMKLSKKICIEH